jgi:lipoate-protein ligase A
MARSRGFTLFQSTLLSYRYLYRHYYSTLGQTATDPARKTQVYISRCLDPYINLSIEHFLLKNTPLESTVLFLYTNRPCIVIGRNQNPWVEVNLPLLKTRKARLRKAVEDNVKLVRRRSGGGAVFHDEGNVNYSVLCPTNMFDRYKHAQMVVRALHGLGVNDAKVNERHDIVLNAVLENSHSLGIGSGPDCVDVSKHLKVSGSAYKITRLRSLHHGTCLLSSPNIKSISQYLQSPAKPYIKARGVGSVSSPIANVNVPNEAFEKAVVAEFGKMYGIVAPIVLSEEACEVPEVAKGLSELRVRVMIVSISRANETSLWSGHIYKHHNFPSQAIRPNMTLQTNRLYPITSTQE